MSYKVNQWARRKGWRDFRLVEGDNTQYYGGKQVVVKSGSNNWLGIYGQDRLLYKNRMVVQL